MDQRHANERDAEAVLFRSFRKAGHTWCHTVGLNARGLPELIVSGLHTNGEPFLKRAAADLMRRSGAVDGDTTDAVADRPVMYRALPVERAGIFAMEAANRDPSRFQALQVVWPDQEGNWPWDAACDPDTARTQSFVTELAPLAATFAPRGA